MIELLIEEYQLLKLLLQSKKIEIIYFSIELPNGEKVIFE